MLTGNELAFFRQHGYLVLPELFTAAEISYYGKLYDQDRSANRYAWGEPVELLRGGHMVPTQSTTNDVLVTTPQIEPCIRNHRILKAVEGLLGGPICFAEISLRYMGPYAIDGPEKEVYHDWHRDRPHWLQHPLRMEYLQAMILLLDDAGSGDQGDGELENHE